MAPATIADARNRVLVREVFMASPSYWGISRSGFFRALPPLPVNWQLWMQQLKTFFQRPLWLRRSHTRRGGRAAECRRLESARGETLRGFKSLPRRNPQPTFPVPGKVGQNGTNSRHFCPTYPFRWFKPPPRAQPPCGFWKLLIGKYWIL